MARSLSRDETVELWDRYAAGVTSAQLSPTHQEQRLRGSSRRLPNSLHRIDIHALKQVGAIHSLPHLVQFDH